MLLLALICLFSMPYGVLMPVFADEILGGGPHTLGFLMTASGVGALAGALWLAGRQSVVGLGRVILTCTAIFAGGLIVFSFSRVFWLSLVALAVVGWGMMVQLAASNTVIQTVVDDEKRGRVMSFYTMAFLGTADRKPAGRRLVRAHRSAADDSGERHLLCRHRALVQPGARRHPRSRSAHLHQDGHSAGSGDGPADGVEPDDAAGGGLG